MADLILPVVLFALATWMLIRAARILAGPERRASVIWGTVLLLVIVVLWSLLASAVVAWVVLLVAALAATIAAAWKTSSAQGRPRRQ